MMLQNIRHVPATMCATLNQSGKMSIFGVEEFETMFREEYRRCLSTALQIVGDAEAGRDIVSDSFAAVWKNRDNIDAEKMRGYLYACVRNKALTHMKHIRMSDSLDSGAHIDVADELGISTNGVKKHIVKAMAHLRSALT